MELCKIEALLRETEVWLHIPCQSGVNQRIEVFTIGSDINET